MELRRAMAAAPRAEAAGDAGTLVAGPPAATGPGAAALGMLDLSRPDLDFTALAAGLGVPATRARTAPAALRTALAEPGPHLIEAQIPPVA